MKNWHSNKSQCSVSGCFHHSTNVDIFYQGGLCNSCLQDLNKEYTQGLTCEYCGVVYKIRTKIRPNEPKYVDFGLCGWCNERKKEEDEIIDNCSIKIENTKLLDFNKITEEISNEKINKK